MANATQHGGLISGNAGEPRGRPPINRAVMKHASYLGGLYYLDAHYREHDFPRHVHDEYLIGLIERGVHDVWCRGELWHAGAGSIATFAPGEPHSGGAGADLGWSQKILYLPEALVRHVIEDGGTSAHGTIDFSAPFQKDEVAAQGLRTLWRLLEEDYPSPLGIEEHLIRLLPRLMTRTGELKASASTSIPLPMRNVRDYIHAHFNQTLQLDILAVIGCCSKPALIEAFKIYLGVTPNRYVIQVRIGEARRLLRQGLEIADVAAAVGFVDQSHLTRHFKAVLGVTPARYLNV